MYKKCSIVYKSGEWTTLNGKAFGYELNDGAIVINCYDEFSSLASIVHTQIFPFRSINNVEFRND